MQLTFNNINFLDANFNVSVHKIFQDAINATIANIIL